MNQSTNQSIEKLIDQSINQSVNKPINHSTNRPIDQQTNQPIRQPTDKSTHSSIIPSFHLSIHPSFNPTIHPPFHPSINQSTTKTKKPYVPSLKKKRRFTVFKHSRRFKCPLPVDCPHKHILIVTREQPSTVSQNSKLQTPHG